MISFSSFNHAIRRADLERRVLETVFPTSGINKKNTTLWTWIRTKLGFVSDADVKYEEHGSKTLMCPWHLLKSGDNSFLIIGRRASNTESPIIPEFDINLLRSCFPNTLEFCRQLVMEKVSLFKRIPDYLLQQQTSNDLSLDGLPYACVTTFQNHSRVTEVLKFRGCVSFCLFYQMYSEVFNDYSFHNVNFQVGQGVLKLSRDSGTCSTFQFSNLRILGLPYWLCFPLERFYARAARLSAGQTDHIQEFSLLPGKVDIRLNIDIPEDTELVEPLHESCIWCQARGAATEALVVEGVAGSSEKVGIAQQWYDELDNLAFSAPESELVIEDDSATTDKNSEDERSHIDCVVNTSPGTSELEMVVGTARKEGISHLACDTVHYNPYDLSDWVQSMLTELNNPTPPSLDPVLANSDSYSSIPDRINQSDLSKPQQNC
ncbi:hypothetical protein PTKIN_Ptkin12aG0100500 [Pterospermum kingtungense]